MFPKLYRLPLRKSPDFFSSTKRWYGAALTVFYRENSGDISQAAVIIPQKKVKKSTRRHELKRQMRNAILPFLMQKPGLELVFVLKKDAEEELLSEVQAFFNS